jgi:phosphatidate phosphatase PAH1
VQGKDAKLDYLFSDGSLSNTIMIMHGKVFKMDTPDSEKYEDVKSFFEEHQDEYISQLQTASNSYNVSLKTTTAEVVEMACGSGAIHVSFMIRGNGAVVVTDYLDFYKKGTEYVALVLTMGDQGNQEELDHLINNISF